VKRIVDDEQPLSQKDLDEIVIYVKDWDSTLEYLLIINAEFYNFAYGMMNLLSGFG
jgi:hypothetical protein